MHLHLCFVPGLLLKSASFNNSNLKPKVQFIGSIPTMGSIPTQKQNMNRATNDARKGLIKKMSESASFKGIRSSCSSAVTKPHPLHPQQAEDLRISKERNMIEKKNATSEHALVSPFPGSAIGNLPSKTCPEAGIASASKDLDINRGPHDGSTQGKSSQILKGTGWSSAAQKPCQLVPKEDTHKFSDAADRSCGILNTPLMRNAPRVVQSSQGNDKAKNAILGVPKQTAQTGSGILRCKKCNETGHPTQFCSIDKVSVSALKPSADRNVRDRHSRNIKTKDAADAPVLKSAKQKDISLPDHSKEASIPSANPCYEVPSMDLQSGASSCLASSLHVDRTPYQDATRSRIDGLGKDVTSVDANLHAFQVESSCVPREILNQTANISDQSNTNFLPKVLPNAASVPADVPKSSVIPELEFIWQ